MQHHAPTGRHGHVVSPDPRVLRPIRQLALAGLALVLVWPAARGYNAWIGWLPLWLVGMPMVAWWGLYRFALPRRTDAGRVRAARQRRRRPQALRRGIRRSTSAPKAA